MLTIKKCVSSNSGALFDAARISGRDILAVGQTATSTKCVLRSTSAAIRCSVKNRLISDAADHLKVE